MGGQAEAKHQQASRAQDLPVEVRRCRVDHSPEKAPHNRVTDAHIVAAARAT